MAGRGPASAPTCVLPSLQAARRIFDAAWQGSEPRAAVSCALNPGDILVHDSPVQSVLARLGEFDRVVVTGAGKASVGMAAAALQSLAPQLDLARQKVSGVVVTKYDHIEADDRIFLASHNVELMEGAHPVTDEAGCCATRRLLEVANEIAASGDKTLVLNFVSGGGSSLTALPRTGLSLQDLCSTVELLLGCGAPIENLNVVRRHLTCFQGGRFAAACFPATVLSLVLSDVICDPLHVIAGGPTAGDSSLAQDAIDVLEDEQFGIKDSVPQAVWDVLREDINNGTKIKAKGRVVVPGDPRLANTYNHVVLNNAVALMAAKQQAQCLGFRVAVLTSRMEGEARHVGKVLFAIAKESSTLFNNEEEEEKPICILAGGESTVTLVENKDKETRLGGRNQEMALAMALELKDEPDPSAGGIVVLCGSSDGEDGPDCPAAGAIASGVLCRTREDFKTAKLFLARNDSYHFFQSTDIRCQHHVITGPTGTNVMDIVVMLCPKRTVL